MANQRITNKLNKQASQMADSMVAERQGTASPNNTPDISQAQAPGAIDTDAKPMDDTPTGKETPDFDPTPDTPSVQSPTVEGPTRPDHGEYAAPSQPNKQVQQQRTSGGHSALGNAAQNFMAGAGFGSFTGNHGLFDTTDDDEEENQTHTW